MPESHLLESSEPASTVIVALLDFDNICERPRTSQDVVGFLDLTLARLVNEVSTWATDPAELIVRLYGGWVEESGRRSQLAGWVAAASAQLRGRRGKMLVKPTMAESIAFAPSETLFGTVRRVNTVSRQKMVDVMIGVDTMFFSIDQALPVLLFSDDDDLVPAVLASLSRTKRRLYWFRRRPGGRGLNDRTLRRLGVSFGGL